MTLKDMQLNVTVACAIGKHKLCNGTGNAGPSAEHPEPVPCECPCHQQTTEDK